MTGLVSARSVHSALSWKILATVVTVASSAWVLWLLVKVWPDLSVHVAEIRFIPLLCGLALSLVASYLTFEAFVVLVRILLASAMPRYQLAHLYFTAQLLKHLPGRVWGIGYQWARARATNSFGDWLLANIGHMLFATFFALWSAWIVLAFPRGIFPELAAVIVGGIAYVVSWLLATSQVFWRWLDWLPAKVQVLGRGTLDVLIKTPVTGRVEIFLFFFASWFFYYTAWALFGMSYPPVGASGGLQLCALYMLAWFVGYVSLLTPSGLGVRELVFAWLAKDFPGDVVALMAVIGRTSLLFVDLIMGLLFARFTSTKS